MKTITSRAAVAALLCSAIVGCSLFAPHHKAPPPAPPPPPPPPEVPQPTANQRFELSPGDDVVGSVQVVQASKEDTLADIARRFNVGYEEIVRANPKVDPWLPGEGTEIVVPSQFILPDAPRTGLVINIPAMRIFYFPPVKKGEKQVVFTHPIGIGKMGWKTPEGVTKITRRQKDPTWHVPVSVRKEHHENGEDLQPVIGPGPDNPLGRYAFYLEWPSYLIHGTNKPSGVGLRSSHGCMRLYPEDIEQFFNMIPVGTQVRVVNQPFVVGVHDGQLYLQPYDALEDDTRDWKKSEQKLLAKSESPRLQQQLQAHKQDIDWSRVTSLSQSPRGIPVRISGPDASLEQVLAAAPRVQNTLPDGSSWDGKSDLPMDESTFKQMMSDAEPKDGAAPATATAPADAKPAKAHPASTKSGG
jgi:L,D-transpeptidase ErfK/SrfK